MWKKKLFLEFKPVIVVKSFLAFSLYYQTTRQAPPPPPQKKKKNLDKRSCAFVANFLLLAFYTVNSYKFLQFSPNG